MINLARPIFGHSIVCAGEWWLRLIPPNEKCDEDFYWRRVGDEEGA